MLYKLLSQKLFSNNILKPHSENYIESGRDQRRKHTIKGWGKETVQKFFSSVYLL